MPFVIHGLLTQNTLNWIIRREKSMEQCANDILLTKGYNINNVPYSYIESSVEWYRNEEIADFHKRTGINGQAYEIDRMNFAKKGCEDDANLCEVINITVGDETTTEQTNKILADNQFNIMYRKQLERMSATGTAGCYIRIDNADYIQDETGNVKVKGGEIKLTYVNAENYIPLKIVNEEILEAAFYGIDYINGDKQTTLVVFTLDDAGFYKAETFVFDKNSNQINYNWIQLADVKPFEVMRTAKVNNIKDMQGFGYPKVYGAIPTLKKLDLCNAVLMGDLDKAEKIVFANDILCDHDDSGKPKINKQAKKLFVFLGKALPGVDAMIKEYNPEIRIDAITATFELCLSLFSMMFGFGSKKYTFDNGQIQTATQYVGERQDAMQELNKQRKESIDYISHIVKAAMWFSNTFNGTSLNLDAEICIDFDDSYIEDKNTMIESMRADAVSFADIPEFTIRYIMERMNLSKEEAIKIYNTKATEPEAETTD